MELIVVIIILTVLSYIVYSIGYNQGNKTINITEEVVEDLIPSRWLKKSRATDSFWEMMRPNVALKVDNLDKCIRSNVAIDGSKLVTWWDEIVRSFPSADRSIEDFGQWRKMSSDKLTQIVNQDRNVVINSKCFYDILKLFGN